VRKLQGVVQSSKKERVVGHRFWGKKLKKKKSKEPVRRERGRRLASGCVRIGEGDDAPSFKNRKRKENTKPGGCRARRKPSREESLRRRKLIDSSCMLERKEKQAREHRSQE